MPTYTVNPLTDARWLELLYRHPSASVFHTPGWLAALQRTYKYEPVVVTTCSPEAELTNGIVFCRVKSLLTGSRLVSLPFSDHCEPLASSEAELEPLLGAISQLRVTSGVRYAELRPRRACPTAQTGFGATAAFFVHELNLTRGVADVFRNFDKDCIQRKIRRAEREGIEYEEGRSERLTSEFYRLLRMTRRRHRVPPQPIAWFHELIACMGESLKVRIASKNGKALASIVTIRFKDAMVYKYGCSDASYHNLGGLPMLLWRAIQEAIGSGLKEFDFGRCDVENEGLAVFKDRWGANKSVLTYWTSPPVSPAPRRAWSQALARQAVKHAPDWLLAFSGRLLYRHVG